MTMRLRFKVKYVHFKNLTSQLNVEPEGCFPVMRFSYIRWYVQYASMKEFTFSEHSKINPKCGSSHKTGYSSRVSRHSRVSRISTETPGYKFGCAHSC